MRARKPEVLFLLRLVPSSVRFIFLAYCPSSFADDKEHKKSQTFILPLKPCLTDVHNPCADVAK